ncbi:MAG: hypothetical protein NUW01_01300 [Gemmatimonadaceae bacterium]|nr:hypothetical protein [Gemmatimonadaceae bacterium]
MSDDDESTRATCRGPVARISFNDMEMVTYASSAADVYPTFTATDSEEWEDNNTIVFATILSTRIDPYEEAERTKQRLVRTSFYTATCFGVPHGWFARNRSRLLEYVATILRAVKGEQPYCSCSCCDDDDDWD